MRESQIGSYVQYNPPTFIEGNGVDKLLEVVNEILNDSLLCVFHTHVANQMPDDAKNASYDGTIYENYHYYRSLSGKETHQGTAHHLKA